MKKYILFLVFIFAFIFSFAQKYQPFPESNAIWTGSYFYLNAQPVSNSAEKKYNVFISGDTTIGKYTYHKLYSNYNFILYFNEYPYSSTLHYYNKYSGSFRQDIPNKKIFMFNSYFNKDTLAYDFNLNIGDTLPKTYLNHNSQNYIDSIDSIQINNVYHKRFWYSAYRNRQGTMIEGIGSTNGTFDDLDPEYPSDHWLKCVIINNIKVWSETYDTSCEIIYSIPEYSVKSNMFLIYPNPANSFLVVSCEMKGNSLIDISICDITGRNVQLGVRNEELGINKIKYDVSGLKNGVYFVRVTENNRVVVGKFVVAK